MKRILTLLFLLTSFFSFSQDLKCSDFKIGNFTMFNDPFIFKIERTENHQVETIIKGPKEEITKRLMKKTHIKLKWVSACSYRMFFDESKDTIDELSKFLNENNGVLVEKLKIKGRCFYYKASSDADGGKQIVKGRICKNDM